jgi:ketosteroid isomerase-like protein
VDTLAAVREVYEEWGRGNYRAGLELYDPAMTLVVHNPIPDAGTYEGLEGLQSYMRRFLDTWEDYKIEATEIEPEGDQVVVEVHHGGRASEAWVEMDYVTVWTFSGDRVVRVDIGQDRETPLAAARDAIA